MLSVNAVYDGKELKFTDRINVSGPHKVIVTFLDEQEEDITSTTMHQIAMQGSAFSFLENPEEDIYSDDDLKVKY